VYETTTLSASQIQLYFAGVIPKTPFVEIRIHGAEYLLASGKIIKYDHMLYRLKEGDSQRCTMD